MANLDNFESMKKLDRENLLGNIVDFPDQVEKTWDDWKNIALPTPYINAKNILILGIGGSAQGAGIAAGLAHYSNVPITVLRDYDIPGWVDRNTLVIAVSYSGETEETLEAFSQAIRKTDKLITVSTGGTLYSIGSQNRALHYRVTYSSQPRCALGINMIAILAILKKLNLAEVSDDDIKEAVLMMRALAKKVGPDVPERRNSAKVLAKKLFGKVPVVFGSGILTEVARRLKGQFNENAKTASYFETLPELNHNSLVGLEFPEDLRQRLFFIILQSKFNHPRNQLRNNITAQILEQKRIQYESILMQPAASPISEICQVILFGDYTSYYHSMLNNVDPKPIFVLKFLLSKISLTDCHTLLPFS